MTIVATSAQAGQLSFTLRRVLILAPPLVLAVYEVFHPQPDVTAAAVMEVAGWFALFHAIQLILFPFLVLSIALLAQNLGVLGHWATRLGLVLALVFFSAYDAIAGIGTGLAMRTARDFSAPQQNAVFDAVKDWPGLGAPFALSIIGTLGWLVALVAIALSARRRGARRSEWIPLLMAGVFLMVGHPFPGGTLAFGSLFIAALLHEKSAIEARRAG